MKVYFSNRLEILFDHLKTNLFCTNTSFFTKRYLIVPNRKMGTWISLRLAEELKIAAGFKICSIDFAFSQMTEACLDSELALTFKLLEELPHETFLNDYLKGKETKITFLASHLAKVFHKYYQYGSNGLTGWQEGLWKKVYKEKPFRFPHEEISIHLFAFPTISPLHFSYFEKAGAFFYQLSPCKEFWSDLKGKKQVAKLFEKKEATELEELFSEANPFLANFGKIGRDLCALIEESPLQTQEDYADNELDFELQRRQNEMLHNEKAQSLDEDDSIQIFSYRTPWEEIEGLYCQIVKVMQEKKLRPSDITVMAPDMSQYVPFIKATFEGKIDFKILDVPTNESKWFFSLLDLEAKRWSPPAVMEVLRGARFYSDEELTQIEKWAERACIRWGYDTSHAINLLRKRFPHTQFNDGRGTWKEGLNFLLRSLASSEVIDFKESELLGKLCLFLQNLYETLQIFHDGTKLTLQQWCLQIEALDPTLDLQRLCEAAPKERTFSFSLIWPLIKKEICKEFTSINSHLLNAITFSSFHTPLPSKIICLIGMNQEQIPRKEKYAFLNVLKKGPKISDEDKYTFLEALLLAKEKLFISYIGRSPFDHTPLPPSTLVEEFGKKAQEVTFPLPTKKIQPFISSFACKIPKTSESRHIELKELLASIKNPLRPYFEKKLHVKFKRDFSVSQDEELQMTPLTLSQMRKESLKTPLKTLLEKAKSGVGLPVGPFNQLACKKIETEIQNLQLIDSEPLEIHSYPVGPYVLSGRIEGVTEESYFTLDKACLKTVIIHLPNFLISKCRTWHFGRDGAVKTFEFSEDLLLKLVRFYTNCHENFCPLYPEMIEFYLERDVKGLRKAIEETFHEELKYILRTTSLPAAQLIDEWSPLAEDLYREVYDVL